MLELDEPRTVERVGHHRHALLAAKRFAHHRRKQTSRPGLHEQPEAVGMHPSHGLLELHRLRPYESRLVAGVARLDGMGSGGHARIHRNGRRLPDPRLGEFPEIRPELSKPLQIELEPGRRRHAGHRPAREKIHILKKGEPVGAFELPEHAGKRKRTQIAAGKPNKTVRTDAARLEKAREGNVCRIDRDQRFRVAAGGKHVCVATVIRRRRKNERYRRKLPDSGQRLFKLVERAAAFREKYRKVAHHVGIEGKSARRDERQLALHRFRFVVRARLVPDTLRPCRHTGGGKRETGAEISRRFRHDRENGRS